MSGSDSAMPEKIGPYQILSVLGRGGMGVVYRALDPRLDREVAIKVLASQFLEDPQRLSRFEREAKAVATLNHPGIVTIHSVEEDQGQRFIVMEMVEGKSLSEEVKPGGLPLSRLLDISIPVVDALCVAHKAGITHRDLKPENIMLTTLGGVKVLDFGLAKMTGQNSSAAEVDATVEYDAQATRQGQILGTPSYMSPEQAEGKEADGRTDVFSLGIILYELATGVRPFKGDTPMSTLTSVLRDEPVPMTELKPGMPRYLGRIISRCLEKSPDRRYQTALDLRNELEQLHKEVSTGDLERPVILDESTTEKSKGWLIPLLAVIAVAISLPFVSPLLLDREDSGNPLETRTDLQENALAVVGFANINDPADSENLGSILSNLITSDLSGTPGLSVLSQPRIAHASKGFLSQEGLAFDVSVAEEIARKAGAGIMVVGTVSKLGDKFVVTAEATRVKDSKNLVSGREEANEAGELFELASRLSDTLREGLGQSTEKKSFDAQQQLTDSAIAYRHYVAGKVDLNRRVYQEAILDFRKAVEEDPTFAMAFLELGIALWWEGVSEQALEEIEKGFGHISRLSEEDRQIYRAFHDMLTSIEYADLAVKILEELVAEGSTNPSVYYLLGECYTHAAIAIDLEKAMGLFLKALELDPTYRVVFFHLLEGYIGSGRVEEGLAFLRKLEQEDPDDFSVLNAQVNLLLSQHRFEEAYAITQRLEKISNNPRAIAFCKANCHAGLGNFELSEKYEAEALETSKGMIQTAAYVQQHANRIFRGKFLIGEKLWEESWKSFEGDRSSELTGNINHSLMGVEYASNLFQQGRIEDCISVLELYRTRRDTQGIPQFWLGYFLVKSDQVAEAEVVLQELKTRAQRYDNTPYMDSNIVLLGALIHSAKGNPQKAREDLDSLKEVPLLNRRVGVERWLRGIVEAELGNPVDGVLFMDQIHTPEGRAGMPVTEIVESLHTQGVMEQDLGEFGSAREHFEQFLKHWGDADIPLKTVEDARERMKILNAN